MIRRSERNVKQEVNNVATWYRVTRIHIFGFCVYLSQRELTSSPPRPE